MVNVRKTGKPKRTLKYLGSHRRRFFGFFRPAYLTRFDVPVERAEFLSARAGLWAVAVINGYSRDTCNLKTFKADQKLQVLWSSGFYERKGAFLLGF